VVVEKRMKEFNLFTSDPARNKVHVLLSKLTTSNQEDSWATTNGTNGFEVVSGL
jgi:hypothetical protein